MAGVKPIPDNYPGVTPYLYVDGASAAIEFYRAVFGAPERMRMADPTGKIGHAEIEIGDSVIMLADEFPELGIKGPNAYGGSSSSLSVYVEDVNAVFEMAITNGATSVRPVKSEFYGDRLGTFLDPFGHSWSVATHMEDVSPEEISRRAEAGEGS